MSIPTCFAVYHCIFFIQVAEGSKLPLTQDQLKVNGHSFEARIYAEDPDNNFMPGAGVLKRLVAPTPVENEVRIETGVTEGQLVQLIRNAPDLFLIDETID